MFLIAWLLASEECKKSLSSLLAVECRQLFHLSCKCELVNYRYVDVRPLLARQQRREPKIRFLG